MVWDFELAISCGLAALAIMHIMNLRRRVCRMRELQSIAQRPADGNHDPKSAPNLTTGDAGDPANDTRLRASDWLIVALLVLALLWFAWRIWMEW